MMARRRDSVDSFQLRHVSSTPSPPPSRAHRPPHNFSAIMARVNDFVQRSLLSRGDRKKSDYQTVPTVDYTDGESASLHESFVEIAPHKISVFEYGIFLLLGVAM